MQASPEEEESEERIDLQDNSDYDDYEEMITELIITESQVERVDIISYFIIF